MNLLSIIPLIFLVLSCNSQEPTFGRIKPIEFFFKQFGVETGARLGADTSSIEQCTSIAIDDDENIYCAGQASKDFGEDNEAGSDVMIMKLSPKGEVIWITQLGLHTKFSDGTNTGGDSCLSIAVDSAKNVYCAGETNGNMESSTSNLGLFDNLIVKLNSKGELVWVRQFGSDKIDTLNDILITKNGDIVVAGSTFGELAPDENPNTNSPSDAFVTKLNSNGTIIWTRQLGKKTLEDMGLSEPTMTDFCNSVTLDKNENIYCNGVTRGSFTESNAGSRDIFIWRLSPSGTTTLLKQFGSLSAPTATLNDSCAQMVFEKGFLYAACSTASDFAEPAIGNDILLMKLNLNGKIIWKKQFGTRTTTGQGNNDNEDRASGAAINDFGFYVTGNSTGSFAGTNGDLSETTTDVVILKVDKKSGSLIRSMQIGKSFGISGADASMDDTATGIVVTQDDSVYVSGYTRGNLVETNIDSDNLTDLDPLNNLEEDIFIFKLDDNFEFKK